MAWKVAVLLAMLAAVAFGTVDWKASTEKGETLVESKSGGHYWTTKTSSFSQFTEIFHEYRMDSGYGSVKKAAAKVQFMSVSFVPRGTRYGDYADAYMTGGSASGYGSGSAAGYGSGSSAGSAYGSGSSAGGYGSGSAAGYGSGSAGSYGSGSSAGYGSGSAGGYGSGSSAGSYGSASSGFPIRLNYVSQPYGRGSAIYWESQTSYGVKCRSKRDTEDADHLISELSLYGKNEGKAVVVTFAVEIVAAGAKLKLKTPNQFESYFNPVGVVKGLFLDMFSPAKDVILISKHVSDTKFLVFAIFNEKNYQRTATFNFKLVIRIKALIAVASGYGSGSGSSAGYGSGSSAGYGSGASSGYGSGSSAGYGSGSSAGYGSGSSGSYGSGSSAGSGYGSGSSAGYGSGSSAGSGYGSGSAGYGSGSSAGSYGSGSSAGYGSGSSAGSYGSGASSGYGSGSDDSAYGLGYDFAGAYGSGSSSGSYGSSDSEYDWSDY